MQECLVKLDSNEVFNTSITSTLLPWRFHFAKSKGDERTAAQSAALSITDWLYVTVPYIGLCFTWSVLEIPTSAIGIYFLAQNKDVGNKNGGKFQN